MNDPELTRRQAARSYREVGKPFATRIVELVRALQLIRDSVTFLRSGHPRHLVTLSGQLRALVADRSGKSKPLLLDVATIMGKELNIYCMPDVADSNLPPELKKDLVLDVAGFPITSFRQFPAQVRVSFSKMLGREIVYFKGSKYSVRTIIDWYANKAGGAHYATRVPEDLAALLSQGSIAAAPIASALVQVGEATMAAGLQLIREFVDLEIHSILVVPPQPDENVSDRNFLFDAHYEGSPMRLTLLVNKRLMPSFFARGLQGVSVQVEADRLVDWSEPRYVHASLRINDDLSTIVEIAIDGQRVGRSRIEEPLFVLADPLQYEVFHNRAVGGEPQRFSFAFGQFSMFSKELDPGSAAKTILHFMEKRSMQNLPIILYGPEAFGHAPKGTKDMHMSGEARFRILKSVSSLATGETNGQVGASS